MTEFTGEDWVTLKEDFSGYTLLGKLRLISTILFGGDWEFEGDVEVTIDVEPPTP